MFWFASHSLSFTILFQSFHEFQWFSDSPVADGWNDWNYWNDARLARHNTAITSI